MTRTLLFSLTFLFLLSTCKKNDLNPSWIKIDEFTFSTNEATQGVNTHGIVDAWVFMDGKAIGVFELPCIIPILDQGEHEFIIFPGIKSNGINKTRVRYPFYNSYTETTTLTLHDTLELFPSTTYKSSTKIAFLEDFESAGIEFTKGPTADTNMTFAHKDENPEIVKYGDKCGHIHLETGKPLYTGSTTEDLDLPQSEVYLEIDFRNSNSIATGVISKFIDGTVKEHTPLVIMNPQTAGEEVWKKIYINLTEDVNFYVNAVSHEIFLLATIDTGQDFSDIYLDNIKVVHFQ